MRILVVEDQKALGLALSRTLEKLGHDPHLVLSGSEAWGLILSQDWRLIITDWVMPEVDGLELCRRIRARQGRPYNYVIIWTGRTGRSQRLQGLAAGADDFLSKPVDEDELAVRLVIAQRILGVQGELEEQNARLGALVTTDPLTGLANRRRLFEGTDVALIQPRNDDPCSIVALDIDHFKAYNDAFGHAAGDEVLRTIAKILRAGTRSADVLVRTGGEEFVVVLPQTGLDEAMVIADRLRAAIENHSWPARRVTASFGVTETNGSTDTNKLKHFLALADHALYLSKRSGRNRVTHTRSLDAADGNWPESLQMTAS